MTERARILRWKVGAGVVAAIIGWLIASTLRQPRTRLEQYRLQHTRDLRQQARQRNRKDTP